MSRKINAKGLAIIKHFEGCKLDSYRCSAGVATVGYGHTGPDVRIPMSITPERAEELLENDLKRFEHGVEALIGSAETSSDEFSALVSLAFNIGLSALATSTVLKRHRLNNKTGAGNAFLMWNRAGGRVLAGLTRRREAERALYRGDAA
jgi:lysozyme